MRRAIFFAAWLISGICSSISLGATYGGGSGTVADPYQIWTAEQMNTIGANSVDWGKCFKLMANIDMSAYTGTQYNIIGNLTTPFTGTFDGSGYIIHNLTYITTNSIAYVGLFGRTSDSIIRNLGVEGINFNTDGTYFGGLVGYQLYGTIASCYSTGSITTKLSDSIGGLVGKQYSGTITSCYSTVSITSNETSCAGGIVGCQSLSTISSCFSAGSVTSKMTYYTGGLVGKQMSGTITNCYSTGVVNSTSIYSSPSSSISYYVGGLVGGQQSTGNITNCYSMGKVFFNASTRSDSCTGGLVGVNDGTITYSHSTSLVTVSNKSYSSCCFYVGGLVGHQHSGSITSCYSTGTASLTNFLDSYIGGLVGYQWSGVITNCRSTGSVTTSADYSYSGAGGLVGYQNNNPDAKIENSYSIGSVSAIKNKGGLLGYKSGSNGIVNASFWDMQTSGLTVSSGGTGKTTEEMKLLLTFTTAAWDFSTVWSICEGTNYPRLQWQIPVGDFACPDGVNVEDLSALSACWMETIEAKADIDADRSVNLNDYIKIAQQWMVTGCDTCGGADITGDGNVDNLDLTLMAEQWLLQENMVCRMADLNNDNEINLADYAIFAQHWLEM